MLEVRTLLVEVLDRLYTEKQVAPDDEELALVYQKIAWCFYALNRRANSQETTRGGSLLSQSLRPSA